MLEEKEFKCRSSDLKTGTFLFDELHKNMYEDGELVESIVEYNTSNRLIARKNSRFSGSKTAPDFHLEDFRDGYEEGAEHLDTGTRLYFRRNAQSPMRERIIQIPEPAVIDSGFDHFVLDNFDALLRGEQFNVNAGISFQLDFYRFVLSLTSKEETGGRECVLFTIEISNFLLKALADSIRMTYDLTLRKPIRYEGISNINDANGRSHKVRTDFI